MACAQASMITIKGAIRIAGPARVPGPIGPAPAGAMRIGRGDACRDSSLRKNQDAASFQGAGHTHAASGDACQHQPMPKPAHAYLGNTHPKNQKQAREAQHRNIAWPQLDPQRQGPCHNTLCQCVAPCQCIRLAVARLTPQRRVVSPPAWSMCWQSNAAS